MTRNNERVEEREESHLITAGRTGARLFKSADVMKLFSSEVLAPPGLKTRCVRAGGVFLVQPYVVCR